MVLYVSVVEIAELAAIPEGHFAGGSQIFSTRSLTENRSAGSASGVDIGLNYRLPTTSLGRFTLAGNAAYLIESYTVSDPGGPRIARLERNGAARWRSDASVFWRKGPWNAGVSAYYIGSLLDPGASTTAAVYESLGRPGYIAKVFDQNTTFYYYRIGSSISYNTHVGYRFKSETRWLRNTQLRFTVNNLLDREPPLTSGGFIASNQQNLLAGRAFSSEWTRTF